MNQRQHSNSYGCHVVPPAPARYVREAGDVTDLVAFLDGAKANAVSGGFALRRGWRALLKPGVLVLLMTVAAIAAAKYWLPG